MRMAHLAAARLPKKISSARSRAIITITSSVIKLRRIARVSASPCPINEWEIEVPPYNTI